MSLLSVDKKSIAELDKRVEEEIEMRRDPMAYFTKRASEEIASRINERILDRILKNYDKSTI